MKYFRCTEEYPRDILDNPLPLGTLYSYVGSSLLSGFINLAKIKKAYVLERYVGWDEVVNVDINIQSPPHSFKWIRIPACTKQELFEAVTKEGATHHVQPDYMLQDDVLILSRTEGGTWVFFWMDRDSSDCCIGRFVTDDSDEDVIKEFDRYVQKSQADIKEGGVAKEIPLHFFAGWIS
jgi:hypothetical protein